MLVDKPTFVILITIVNTKNANYLTCAISRVGDQDTTAETERAQAWQQVVTRCTTLGETFQSVAMGNDFINKTFASFREPASAI